MKMVASAKLHKAQGAIENMLPYQRKLNKILTNFLSADLPVESPFCVERPVKRVAIVAFFFQQFFMRCFQCECTENVFADGGRISRVGTR